jgi:hypothetical protein
MTVSDENGYFTHPDEAFGTCTEVVVSGPDRAGERSSRRAAARHITEEVVEVEAVKPPRGRAGGLSRTINTVLYM